MSIDGILMLPNHNWAPYADTLIVDLPEDHEQRRNVFELMEHVGRHDEHHEIDQPLLDSGQKAVRLRCD